MKKLLLFVVLLLTMPMEFFGQTYATLWKQVEKAEKEDLPQTQQKVLQRIIDKARRSCDYGHLLKAELMQAQVMAQVSSDSLAPAVERIRLQGESETDEVLHTVYQTILYRVSKENRGLNLKIGKPELTPALCAKLAAVTTDAYEPMVVKGYNSKLFDHDLLSLIGYALDDLEPLVTYYRQTGNRRAACIASAECYEYGPMETLDQLIEEYADLPEAGELALHRYKLMPIVSGGLEEMNRLAAERVAFIDRALSKWGGWQGMNELRNERNRLTAPLLTAHYEQPVVRAGQSQTVILSDLRNLRSLSLKIYKVKTDGDTTFNLNDVSDLKKLKPLLTETGINLQREYAARPDYEHFADTLTIEALPVGVYLLELASNPETKVVRSLYHVTEVYTICESQPDNEQMRLVVVNATTGQPVAGARLRLSRWNFRSAGETYEGVTNKQGEYFFKDGKIDANWRIFAYTDNDRACPAMTTSGHYAYYPQTSVEQRVEIYTDRAIYRPGQTVNVATLSYQTINGLDHQVTTNPLTLRLRDVNWKVLNEKEVTPDDYGVASAQFTLPQTGLNGIYFVEGGEQRQRIRVEEYKRPTFHVDFDEVTDSYKAGDTLSLRGTALSYAGVPVGEARVNYRVERRVAFWWWRYSRYWSSGLIGYGNADEEIATGVATTDSNGHFDVSLPLALPETTCPMFYHFVVTADVTDAAGETHNGQISLPLGNRHQALSVDLEEKILKESDPKLTFHLLNAAGKDIDATVEYLIDNGAWQTGKTNTPLSMARLASLLGSSKNHPLSSGAHSLKAVFEGDTIERRFTVFSLDDECPATETDDWFYVSAQQFPNDGTPVTVQVGSSAEDMHIVYSIFAGKQVIERGAIDKSNALWNRKLTYREDYGNGLLLTFAWVKNGHCYTHAAQIKRPVPDKQLRMEWATFRDRLTPGLQEEWTLAIRDKDGNPVEAQLMATLYDHSLDQLAPHQWSLVPYTWLPLPSASWRFAYRSAVGLSAERSWDRLGVTRLELSHFDNEVFPSFWCGNRHGALRALSAPMMKAYSVKTQAVAIDAADELLADAVVSMEEEATAAQGVDSTPVTEQEPQLRENLQETAFFYPQLQTDGEGRVSLKFTLPESLTTWRFMGIAHTQDMHYGLMEGLAVAQKDVMIQPNMPRFLRQGDKGTIAARISNTSDRTISGRATLRLRNPESDAIIIEQTQEVTLAANSTTPVSFTVSTAGLDASLFICQLSVMGDGFSDGEQHYLPILPERECVTVTKPVTRHEAGEVNIELSGLVPQGAVAPKLTFEYTTDPAWLMVQALPAVGQPQDDNAISLAAAYYANRLGQYIIAQTPDAKRAFQLWQQEGQGDALVSQLEKNQNLKSLVLSETPWVMDAEGESEQRRRLADFFDDNLMSQRLGGILSKLSKLQLGDGSWSWWEGMNGSLQITTSVSDMLVRLNALTGEKMPETKLMLDQAFEFMGNEIIREVEEMKKMKKEGRKPAFPSFSALRWLYLCAIDGRKLPVAVEKANDYLMPLLKKDVHRQTLLEKAMTAVILQKSDPKRSANYVQSLKEFTVYREDIGRYYDAPRAAYSWFDYRIPTQTMVIEALQRITPDDRQTIEEMQRWLLQEKRTQAWDSPINSVDAVYAFLSGKSCNLSLSADTALSVTIDAQPLSLPKPTAALGYVKTVLPHSDAKTLTVCKSNEGTSWGAVYAQFFQKTSEIASSSSDLHIERELICDEELKVGSRVVVRITIVADRDLDFVQVVDRRAACMEPVKQLSGYYDWAYRVTKDNTTNFYFHQLPKGKHTLETEYYIDRTGTYETGTCAVECAYAPEFRATAESLTMVIKN